MLCGKDREIEQRHRVKNLLHGWHLPAFPTTGTDPSLALRMTISVSCHYDAFCPVSPVTAALCRRKRVAQI